MATMTERDIQLAQNTGMNRVSFKQYLAVKRFKIAVAQILVPLLAPIINFMAHAIEAVISKIHK